MEETARSLHCLLLAAVLCGWSAAACADVAGEGWTFRQAQDACVLEAHLPDLGAARFTGSAAGGLRFELLTHRDPFAEGTVQLGRVAPPWHPEHPSEAALGGVPHVAGGSVLVIDPLATRLLMALYGGYEARLTHDSWYAGGTPVEVHVSSLRFRSVYEPFARCLRGASSYGWAELERSRIEYAPADFQLTPEDQQRLRDVARYAAADRGVDRIYVDGHTDDVGSASDNLQLSRRRAETVRDALVALGVPAERVVVRYHGARYPVAGNDSEAGRAQNRRTTVRLERAGAGEDGLASR